MQTEDPGAPNPSEGDGPEPAEEPRHTAFARRLRERFGGGVDPHISLEPRPTEAAPRPPSDFGDFEDPARERIARLGNLTPGEFRYQFRGEIGRGGMGAVLKVWDRDLGRHLAMKAVIGRGTATSGGPVDHGKLTRFLEEAQITGQLDHPGVVPVHELGMDSHGRVFFTMRLVRGRDLRGVIDALHGAEGAPPLEGWTRNRALTALLRVCETMAYAHAKGVIHRDLKPANVMVGRYGEVYVMDWGLAKVLGREDTRDLRLRSEEESVRWVTTDRSRARDGAPEDEASPLITMDGDVVGTPAYMAPEQARGERDKEGPQSDVYSIGALLYHLLTGRAPYASPGEHLGPHVILMRVLAGPPARIHTLTRDVPTELQAICEKAMAYSRRQRYASVLELADDLSAFLEGRVVQAYETGPIAEAKKWVERNKRFAATIAVAFVALVATLARIGYLKAESSDTLSLKNTQLTEAMLEANRNAAEADDNARLLGEALERAEDGAEALRRRNYLASLTAADANLRLEDTERTTAYLEDARGDLGGWEWEHLALAADASLAVHRIGRTMAQVLAASPDGTTYACLASQALREPVIELRQLATGDLLRRLSGHSLEVLCLAISPDGRTLASGAQDQTVRLWSLAGGPPTILRGFDSWVTAVAWSPDGSVLAAGGRDGSLRLFDARKTPLGGEALRLAEPGGGQITDLGFTPDGVLLAGTAQGLVHRWDPAASGEPDTLHRATHGVSALAIPRKGGAFAVLTEGGEIQFLSTANGTVVATRTLETAVPRRAVFLADGRLLVACSDGLLRLWSLAEPGATAIHGHLADATALAIPSSGPWILSGSRDGTVRLWSRFSFQAHSLFVGHEDTLLDLAFSPDGATLATASQDGTVRLWDAASHEPHHLLRGHANFVRCLAYDPAGEWLATGSGDSTIRLWDADAGELFTILTGHTKWVADLAFSPDGRTLASASGDGTVRVWDLESETASATLEGHGSWVHAVAWNRSGTRLLSADADGTVIEWDPWTPREVARHDLGERGLRDVLYAADDATILAASLDGTIVVLEPGSAEPQRLTGHTGGVTSLALSPDGARMASTSEDGTLAIWRTEGWERLLVLRPPQDLAGESGPPRAASFSPDGHRLAAGLASLAVTWETEPPIKRHDAIAAATTVRSLVDGLLDDLVVPAAVIEALRADVDLSGRMREAAIEVARVRSQDAQLLQDQAWATARTPGLSPEAYRRAEARARMAHDLAPDHPETLLALAGALYRTDELDETRELLETLVAEGYHSEEDPHPAVEILRALVDLAEGDTATARERLDALDDGMQRPLWDERAGDLYAEARELLGA